MAIKLYFGEMFLVKIMNTKIVNFNDKKMFYECVEEIKNGGVVVFPTETVYGVGANALSKNGVVNIFKIKNRGRDNPLIVHVCDYDISKYVENVSEDSMKLIEKFWPGPLTIIFKKKSIIPNETTSFKDSVGIRMPNNNIALEFIKSCGCPIAAPSANISGRPSGTNAKRCFEDLNGRVKFIIDGFDSQIGLESTVISMINDEAIILRPGYISLYEIKKILPKATIYSKINEKFLECNPISPGLKYKHYAPKCKMVIINGDKFKILNYVKDFCFNFKTIGILCTESNVDFYKNSNRHLKVIGVGNDFSNIGKNLFESIRKLDDLNCDFIISEMFYDDFSNAVMNRLLRAASHNVITL